MLADTGMTKTTIFTAAPVLALCSPAAESGSTIFTTIFLVMNGHFVSSRQIVSNHSHQELVDAVGMKSQHAALTPLNLYSLEETAACRM